MAVELSGGHGVRLYRPMKLSEQAPRPFSDANGESAPVPSLAFAQAPVPASEPRAWLLACSTGLLGVLVLVAVLSGVVGRTATTAPPPVVVSVATPAPAPA